MVTLLASVWFYFLKSANLLLNQRFVDSKMHTTVRGANGISTYGFHYSRRKYKLCDICGFHIVSQKSTDSTEPVKPILKGPPTVIMLFRIYYRAQYSALRVHTAIML